MSSEEAAARQWSMDWTAVDEMYGRLMSLSDPGDIFRALNTLESSFDTPAAKDYLAHHGTTIEGLSHILEENIREYLVEVWTSGDPEEIVSQLAPYVGDNWEPDENGGWRIPGLVKKCRALLAEDGSELDETAWNEMVSKHCDVPRLGSFIGHSPTRGPRSVAGLARRVIQAATSDVDLADAVLVLAYCRFNRRYSDAVSFDYDQVSVIADAVRVEQLDDGGFQPSDLDGLGCRCGEMTCGH